VKPSSIEKIKSHIEQLVYRNLLHEPMNGSHRPSRVAAHVDRDYVTALSQIRSYLYGDLSERTVQRFQRGEIPSRRFKGVMAAYPLIDDDDQLIALDGWLVNVLYPSDAEASEAPHVGLADHYCAAVWAGPQRLREGQDEQLQNARNH
jgi:RNA-directed DNA polymerase